MTDFPAVLQLYSLDGSNGFALAGEGTNDHSGYAVATAGDINGDGYDDFIIGAFSANTYRGASYVVFGGAGGFPSTLNLSSLDGTTGFKIPGLSVLDQTGFSVASAGDVNKDGYDDIIIGGQGVGSYAGASYVVFGKASGFSASLDLTSLNGTNGFKISGVSANDNSGRTVSSAGDINGDGFADVIIGAYGVNGQAGATYVVFGKASGFSANLSLSALNGTNGFVLNGSSLSGWSVASAGDVNGDGFDDILTGAWLAGSVSGVTWLMFGHGGSFASSLNVSSFDGTNGVRIVGPALGGHSGWSVSGAGDINKDGFADIIIGGPLTSTGGVAYVVFGHAGGFSSDLLLANLNGTDGFKITGSANEGVGWSVDGAGDVNGDGYADLIVGAHFAGPNGTNSGAAYVVFGKAGGFAATLDVSTLNGSNGFEIAGASTGGKAGTSVAGAGDINHDGYDDLIVGAPFMAGNTSHAGVSYIILGHATTPAAVVNTGTSGDDVQTGAGGADNLSGGAGNDTLYGLAGVDTLNGGDGNDIIDGGTGADAMTGGTGDDTFYVDDAGDTTTEAAGEGYDTVRASLNWTLGANLDQLILDGTGDFSGTGNSLGNVVTGNSGNNSLDGGDGNDILNGGLGNDSLTGGNGVDQLNGGDGTDTLSGGAGGDILDGGVGADTMSGGTGDDTYYVDDAGDLTLENSGEGNDVVRTTINWTLSANIETLILEGAGNINGTGNGLANVMTGNSGANVMDGGDGDDLIKGGAGDDTLTGGNGAHLLYGGDGVDAEDGQGGNDVMSGGNGDDIMYGGIGNDILDGGADNDTLDGGTGNDQLQGGAGTDTLSGGDGNDVLDGGTGADAMSGGLGDDTYYVDDAGDTTTEASGAGTDIIHASLSWVLGGNIENLVLDGSGNFDGTGNSLVNAITGNSGNNSLDGGAGDDVLKGGLGNDILIGGAGSDILVGGGGADTFKVTQASVIQSHLGGSVEVDTVNDLITAQGDKVDLSAIDADSVTAGDQAFHLVSNFSHHAAEMTLTFSGGITLLSLDVDGDGSADYRMKISGDVHLDSGGWVL